MFAARKLLTIFINTLNKFKRFIHVKWVVIIYCLVLPLCLSVAVLLLLSFYSSVSELYSIMVTRAHDKLKEMNGSAITDDGLYHLIILIT